MKRETILMTIAAMLAFGLAAPVSSAGARRWPPTDLSEGQNRNEDGDGEGGARSGSDWIDAGEGFSN